MTPTSRGHFPPASPREPNPVDGIGRPALCCRIHTARLALDLLWSQVQADGYEPFTAIGPLKIELQRLEQQLRDHDAAQRGAAVSQEAREIALAPFAVKLALAGRSADIYAPTEKQVAFYQRLVDSPVFTEEERRRALEWLATKATQQTIKDQLDWLREQVQNRRLAPAGGAS